MCADLQLGHLLRTVYPEKNDKGTDLGRQVLYADASLHYFFVYYACFINKTYEIK